MGFLLTKWQLVVIGLLLFALTGSGIYVKMLKSDISAIEAEKALVLIKLGVSNASIISLQLSINEQNAAIDKLKSDADVRVAAHAAEIVKAKNTANLYLKQAQYLMSLQPPVDRPICDAANDLYNLEIQNAK